MGPGVCAAIVCPQIPSIKEDKGFHIWYLACGGIAEGAHGHIYVEDYNRLIFTPCDLQDKDREAPRGPSRPAGPRAHAVRQFWKQGLRICAPLLGTTSPLPVIALGARLSPPSFPEAARSCLEDNRTV